MCIDLLCDELSVYQEASISQAHRQFTLFDPTLETTDTLMTEADVKVGLDEQGADDTALDEGMLLDYITKKPVKDTAKEKVRQRIMRAPFHKYGISVHDTGPDFCMKVGGKYKKIGLVIFTPNTQHS